MLFRSEEVQPDKRQGKFVSVVALALPDGRTEICRGEIHGVIRYSPVGDGGFGYDPIFQPDGYDVTMAQLSADEKDSISHRGRAMREIAPVIAQLLSE